MVNSATLVTIVDETISLVVGDSGSVWAVNWDLLVVNAKSMTVGVWVREKSSLQHFIVRWLDAWHQVRGREGRLLDLCVIVLWVSVEGELSHLDEGVIRLRPDLGDVEYVELVVLGISLGHHLHEPGPGGEVAGLDVLVQIGLRELSVLDKHGVILLGCKVFDALVGLEMILDQMGLSLGVDPLKGVG